MSRSQVASQTRQKVFEACSRILQREGLSNLTLEAVADEAGISKGGLLYHFPNKVELIEALFEYHNDIFETRLCELVELEGNHPGAWLRAYAKASIEQIENPDNISLYVSLFAAEERYDSAHRLMRDKYTAWQKRIDETRMDSDWAMLIRFAVDGLWFAEIHHYAPPEPERRERIINMILDLTYKKEMPAD